MSWARCFSGPGSISHMISLGSNACLNPGKFAFQSNTIPTSRKRMTWMWNEKKMQREDNFFLFWAYFHWLPQMHILVALEQSNTVRSRRLALDHRGRGWHISGIYNEYIFKMTPYWYSPQYNVTYYTLYYGVLLLTLNSTFYFCTLATRQVFYRKSLYPERWFTPSPCPPSSTHIGTRTSPQWRSL